VADTDFGEVCGYFTLSLETEKYLCFMEIAIHVHVCRVEGKGKN
jgi:hypothetical protein